MTCFLKAVAAQQGAVSLQTKGGCDLFNQNYRG